MISRSTIDDMAASIARRFRPQRIVLFGSYARGDATENSDVDLLVITRDVGPRGRRSAPILEMLAERFDVPVDIVVLSPEDLQAHSETRGSVAHSVAQEGVTLYDSRNKRRSGVVRQGGR